MERFQKDGDKPAKRATTLSPEHACGWVAHQHHRGRYGYVLRPGLCVVVSIEVFNAETMDDRRTHKWTCRRKIGHILSGITYLPADQQKYD